MSVIHLEARLVKIKDWTIVRLPEEVSKQLPSRGQVVVKGSINGYRFHTPLEPDGKWSHWLNVDKEMQQATGLKAGDTATLEIESTKEWPEPDVPADWQAVLDTDPEILSRWKRVTPLARWEWLRWIGSSGVPETRQKHIEVSCSKMMAGERRPCCFNRSMCCVPEVSKGGILLEPDKP